MQILVNEWLQFKQLNEGRSAETIKKYRYYLTLYLAFCEKSLVDPYEPKQLQLEQFTGLFLHQMKLVPQSRRTAVAALRGFYEYLFNKGHTHVNFTASLPYPASSQKIPVAMGLRSFEQLLQSCDLETFIGIRDAAIIALMGGCGLRLAGIVSLNLSNIVSYEHDGVERLAIRVVEKGKKERQVPLPMEVQLFLRVYIGHPDLRYIDRTLPNGDQVLFISTNNRRVKPWDYYGENRRISPRTIQKMIHKRGIAAGVPTNQAHPHALRHLTGTEYAEEDLDIITRQTLLGHSDPKTTEIYTQLALRKLTKQVDKGNPLGKITTAVTPLLNALKK